MEKINSFDVFDTLLARRYLNNDIVLNTMEQVTKIKDFAAHRKAADNGSRSLLQMYEYLHEIGIISKDQIHQLKELEIVYEIDASFPIKQNLDKIKNGDLLISDMYLSGSDILTLVRSIGLDKQVSIYQSSGDKRTGEFWQKAKENGLQIDTHYGDNELSDVINPQKFGFNAVHFKDSIEPTDAELFLRSQNLNVLSYLMREIRLRNVENDHPELFDSANQMNLPWLFLVCELINRQYKGQPVVFLSRDCQLMYKIYNSFYERCHYLPFSRKVALNQTEIAAKYLKNQTPDNAVIFDMSSTGRTWEKICSIEPVTISVVIFENRFYYSKEAPKLPESFSFFITGSDIAKDNPLDLENSIDDCNLGLILELLNCGDHGYLNDIKQFGDVYTTNYAENDIDDATVCAIHKPVNMAVDLSVKYATNIKHEMSKLPISTLTDLFKQFLKQIYSQRFLMQKYKQFANKSSEYDSMITKLEGK